jgi:hypothetical protein
MYRETHMGSVTARTVSLVRYYLTNLF